MLDRGSVSTSDEFRILDGHWHWMRAALTLIYLDYVLDSVEEISKPLAKRLKNTGKPSEEWNGALW